VILGLDRIDLNQPQATLKIVAARNAQGMTVELIMDYSIGVLEEAGAGRPRAQIETGRLIDEEED
jgi:hypothetical protein